MGEVETAIKARFAKPETLHTLGEARPFGVRVTSGGLQLALGAKQTKTALRWACVEGIVPYLRARAGWTEVGGWNSNDAKPRTLDEYLKEKCTRTNVARWLAVVLAEAGVAEVQGHPLRIRLSHPFA